MPAKKAAAAERDNNQPQLGFVDPVGQPTLFELPPKEVLSLADRFGVPPFSVLDARSGQWQDRKRAWITLGIRSELGRDDKLLDYVHLATAHEDKPCRTCTGTGTAADGVKRCRDCQGTGKMFANHAATGSTSIFDPVLCELAYRWFSPLGGLVLDPFAGGSVRGLVAAVLGRDYVGIDLREEQVKANYQQAEQVILGREGSGTPVWIQGDSRDLPKLVKGEARADFVFTCPPYFDLEKYSSDVRDLSNAKGYPAFLSGYRDIIGYSCRALKPDRFACFVVGEVRTKDGGYYGLVPDTIQAFRDHGLTYYNELVLVTPLGTAPVRATPQFMASRKMVKAHQNMLVFLKGDAKAATAAMPLDGANASTEGDAWIEAEQQAAQVEAQ